MKKSFLILSILLIGLASCESDKKYSDYNENDFYEVQGIITSAFPTSDPFDLPPMKNIKFDYFLSDSIPLSGEEKNIQAHWAEQGIPIIVLVHNKDNQISFCGRKGLKDSLGLEEQIYIKNIFDNLTYKKQKTTYNTVYSSLLLIFLSENTRG